MRSIHLGGVLLFLMTLFGCQKGDMRVTAPDPDPNFPPAAPVTAKIILPEGSVLAGTSLTVTNGRFHTTVSGDTFAIDTSSVRNTFSFVTGDDHKPYLLKYYSSGSADYDISAHSTALALLMSSPLASSLTVEGRQNLVQFISSTTEFATLENEIKNAVTQGIPITDSSNTKMNDALLATFEKMSAGGTVGDTTSPLIIQRNGRTITIQNNGAANAYVAGLYKDGNLQGELTVVNGTVRSAPSLSQAVSGMYLPFSSADRKEIKLEGDGNFQLRIRSGNTAASDNSDENALAAKINVIDVAWSIAERFFTGGGNCMSDVKKQLINDYPLEVPDFDGSLSEVSNAIYVLASKIVTSNVSGLSGCYDSELFPGFSESVKSYISYLATVSSNATGAINVGPRLFHLYNNQSQLDFCYTANGDNITECNNVPSDTFLYQAFHAVPGTTIGAAIEFRLTFKGSEVSGTARSISFDFGSGEQIVPVNGSLVGNTMTLFIHADNNITPQLLDCVPQPAPHCSTCRYTGDHVVQDWEITGTVNENHSTYNAEYTRKYTYTSVVVNKDCTTSTVIDEAEENGALSY
ncbi:MAG: hypothetical protein JNK79_07075 [Chitinophagaceae bacterium]|nr:hypothetical protein [Chitinophagaceae bacterium]